MIFQLFCIGICSHECLLSLTTVLCSSEILTKNAKVLKMTMSLTLYFKAIVCITNFFFWVPQKKVSHTGFERRVTK